RPRLAAALAMLSLVLLRCLPRLAAASPDRAAQRAPRHLAPPPALRLHPPLVQELIPLQQSGYLQLELGLLLLEHLGGRPSLHLDFVEARQLIARDLPNLAVRTTHLLDQVIEICVYQPLGSLPHLQSQRMFRTVEKSRCSFQRAASRLAVSALESNPVER